jgi:hypothetical protein
MCPAPSNGVMQDHAPVGRSASRASKGHRPDLEALPNSRAGEDRRGASLQTRMTARELDAGLREYARVAGTTPPPSSWAEGAEPF